MRVWLAILWLGLFSSPAVGWGADRALFYEDSIRPLLKAHCFSCHGESDVPEAGLDLRLVHLMRRGGDGGPAIVPGHRATSLLYQRLVRGEMPPPGKPPLSAEDIERIGQWIEGGAPTRRPEPAQPVKITDEDRSFWSFRPLRRPPIPEGQPFTWPQGPVDAFVLQRLEAAGIGPAPAAPPRALARRLSFVLTGLPPSVAAVQEFEEDPSPQRYVSLVDRYLASPHFGERWARFWLDLVRYVDETPDYLASAKHAFRYRDWVIRALNDDLPYDEFVRRQLAADLIAGLPPEEHAALGLLGLSPTYWKELRLAPVVIETVVADEWDERIDTVTRTFLGLTVSCARCHDHKFDPVTMEDYYALAGIMASTQLAERPLLPAAEAEVVLRAREQLTAWEEQLKGIKEATAPEAMQLREQIAALRAETPQLSGPWANVVEEASVYVLPDGAEKTRLEIRRGEVRDLPVFRRGNPADPAAVVERRFLDVLTCTPTIPINTGSGRLEFAEALVSDAHPLLARVLVNRVWAQVFGQGLVRTTSDFGRQGEPPTHPELLEYLASRLVEEHWSLKRLIRELVTSATFQQESAVVPATRMADPSGQLLSRMPRRRLDVESWRDALLVTTGALDDRLYGPAEAVDAPDFRRRTLYGRVVREELNTMLRLYDFPEPNAHSPARDPTTTPLQQLFVLNGPLLSRLAADWSTRLADDGDERDAAMRITECYRYLFQRAPTASEQALGADFLKDQEAAGSSTAAAWEAYLHVLLGLNEMLFLD